MKYVIVVGIWNRFANLHIYERRQTLFRASFAFLKAASQKEDEEK